MAIRIQNAVVCLSYYLLHWSMTCLSVVLAPAASECRSVPGTVLPCVYASFRERKGLAEIVLQLDLPVPNSHRVYSCTVLIGQKSNF